MGAQVGWATGLGCMVLWTFFYQPPYGTLAGLNAAVVNLIVLVVVSLLVPEKQELKDEREAIRQFASQDSDVVAAAAARVPVVASPVLAK